MASPDQVYVAYQSGPDGGLGTLVSPYTSLTYAFTQVTHNTTWGTQYNLWDGTTHPLTVTLSVPGTLSVNAPAIIRGYTSAANDGGIGKLDMGSTADRIYDAAKSHVHFFDLELIGGTHATSQISLTIGSLVDNVYFHGYNNSGGSVIMFGGRWLRRCRFEGNTAAYSIFTTQDNVIIAENWMHGAGISLAGIRTGAFNNVVRRNILTEHVKWGVYGGGGGLLEHNSIHCTTPNSDGRGVYFEDTSTINDMISNIVEGYSGATGIGYRLEGRLHMYGKNASYDNTTAYDQTQSNAATLYGIGDNETLNSTPFAKTGSNTYANRLAYFAPLAVGNVQGGSHDGFDKGALQRVTTFATVPTLAVVDNGDGTVTATVGNSISTSTNTFYYHQTGTTSWTSGGSRTGNGTIPVSLTNGRYFGYVISVVSDTSAVSSLVTFTVINGTLLENLLPNSPSEIIRQLLIDNLQGSDVADGLPNGSWPVYFNNEPTTPDNCITVYDTPGEINGVTNTDNELQEHFGIQVRVRGTSGSIAWTKTNSLNVYLNQSVYAETVIIDSNQYLVESVITRSDIIPLGKEMPGQGSQGMVAKGRNINTFNAVVSLRKLN